jgi:hypothetical protein
LGRQQPRSSRQSFDCRSELNDLSECRRALNSRGATTCVPVCIRLRVETQDGVNLAPLGPRVNRTVQSMAGSSGAAGIVSSGIGFPMNSRRHA